MSTNVCIVEGRLTRDAEYSTFGQNDTPKLSFSFANNTGYGEYKKVHYFSCEIIGKKADSLRQYMIQGKAANLTGEMQQNRWEDQDGNKKNKWLLHVIDVSFTSGSKDNQESGEHTQNNSNNNQRQGPSKPPESHHSPQDTFTKADDPFSKALAAAKPESEKKSFYKPNQEADYGMDDVPF